MFNGTHPPLFAISVTLSMLFLIWLPWVPEADDRSMLTEIFSDTQVLWVSA
jgi:hypothetical protein